MEWLNYHHLFYFSMIAEAGGVAPAARRLRVTHSTLSAQLAALEAHLGAPLFERVGKRLVLTPFGREAASYATDIFRLGRELHDVARGRTGWSRESLRIGVAAGIPKALAVRLLSPALERTEPHTAFVHQYPAHDLAEELASGRLHVVVINDAPPAAISGRLYAHPLGETGILLYGNEELARRARDEFPRALESVPVVLPAPGMPLRRQLDTWFAEHEIVARINIEVNDDGLLLALGAAGQGVVPVRAVQLPDIRGPSTLRLVGACEGVREFYYALTTERRVRHPAVSALIEHARATLSSLDVRRAPGRNAR